MTRTTTLRLLALALTALVSAPRSEAAQHGRPRLVVTMMVDQMTWDYLYRYQARFVEGGFKRLLSRGFNCENTRINYLPAYTAIGHSSVHTGSVPAIHGIAGNDFFKDGKPIYCTQDTLVASVGVPNGKQPPDDDHRRRAAYSYQLPFQDHRRRHQGQSLYPSCRTYDERCLLAR